MNHDAETGGLGHAGQWAERQPLENAEDRGVAADAEREHSDHRE